MPSTFRLAALLALLLAACVTTPRRSPSREAATPSPEQARPGESVRQFDVDHDGKTDLWKVDAGEGDERRTVRKEVDVDRDGRVDVRYHYAADGSLEREELDLDFDGRFDTVNVYAGGEKVRAELDLDGDGRADVIKHYRNGKLVRKEFDENGDGRPERYEYWEDGVLDRVGEDRDGDGVVDRWIQAPAPGTAG